MQFGICVRTETSKFGSSLILLNAVTIHLKLWLFFCFGGQHYCKKLWAQPSSCSVLRETYCWSGHVTIQRPCCVGCVMPRCFRLPATCLCWRGRLPMLWQRHWRQCVPQRRAAKSSCRCWGKCRITTAETCKSGSRDTAGTMQSLNQHLHLWKLKVRLL